MSFKLVDEPLTVPKIFQNKIHCSQLRTTFQNIGKPVVQKQMLREVQSKVAQDARC
jgi:hypothetical protein